MKETDNISATAEKMNEVYSQYEGKSETDLMEELIKLKEQGAIKQGQMAKMAEQIAPMLNEEQRRRLNAILMAFNEV